MTIAYSGNRSAEGFEPVTLADDPAPAESPALAEVRVELERAGVSQPVRDAVLRTLAQADQEPELDQVLARLREAGLIPKPAKPKADQTKRRVPADLDDGDAAEVTRIVARHREGG